MAISEKFKRRRRLEMQKLKKLFKLSEREAEKRDLAKLFLYSFPLLIFLVRVFGPALCTKVKDGWLFGYQCFGINLESTVAYTIYAVTICYCLYLIPIRSDKSREDDDFDSLGHAIETNKEFAERYNDPDKSKFEKLFLIIDEDPFDDD